MNYVLAWVCGSISFVYAVLSFLMWYLEPQYRADRKAAVVVLGDLGHSPRMCFHALSIASVGCPVTLIGYAESELMEDVRRNPLIEVSALPAPARRGRSYLWYALRRVLTEHYALYRALKAANPTVVLVQNPPSIPTLGVARFVTLWTVPGAKLIIDWHNLGFSILALTQRPWLVRVYRAYELVFGRIAYLHLCVSVRLGMALKTNLRINPKRVMPLYDRPFKQRLVADRPAARARFAFDSRDEAAWVVTSTSYTPDEDLGMLLDALELYRGGPRVKCIVTGKGPLKAQFEADVARRRFPNAEVHTAWLPYEDYHVLLGVCDLGISLHRSSSGWDLPMKVVDMFGAGLPVLALAFPALDELVTPANGLTFEDAPSLERGLQVLQDAWKLGDLKKGAVQESRNTWFEQWKDKLGPVFGYGQWTGEESSSSDSE